MPPRRIANQLGHRFRIWSPYFVDRFFRLLLDGHYKTSCHESRPNGTSKLGLALQRESSVRRYPEHPRCFRIRRHRPPRSAHARIFHVALEDHDTSPHAAHQTVFLTPPPTCRTASHRKRRHSRPPTPTSSTNPRTLPFPRDTRDHDCRSNFRQAASCIEPQSGFDSSHQLRHQLCEHNQARRQELSRRQVMCQPNCS